MLIHDFLDDLNQLGIELWVENDKIKYRATPGALTAELREQVAELKTEIITFLNTVQDTHSVNSEAIKPQERSHSLPLSTAQKRLWFLEQLMSNHFAYNVSGGIQLIGDLKVENLHRALNEIVRRHESLRTTFQNIDGRPIQVIAPTLTLELPIADLRSLSTAQQETEILNRAVSESQRPFQLDRGPLLHCTLLCCAEDNHVLLLNMHHIITDGWSLNVFIQELQTLYSELGSARSCILPPLPIQYADFALWQEKQLQTQAFQDQLSYWKQQLAGLEPLSLPSDRPRPALQSFRGGIMGLTLPGRLMRELEHLSGLEKVSLSTLMLSAFQALLYRYTHRTDIAIATPIANRNRSELESLIGFFVNTLILRTNLDGNPPFRDFLKRTHKTTLEAYDRQDVPFEKIVESLYSDRDLSYNPLSTISYAFQSIPGKPLQLEGLTLSPIEYDRGTTRYDLELHIWHKSDQSSNWFLYCQSSDDNLDSELSVPDEDDFIAIANYSTDLFDPATIRRLLHHYLNLLQAIIANPDRPIYQLSLLTPPERHQILQVYSHTCPSGDGVLIHQQFERQAQNTPNHLAIVGDNCQITYQSLNGRANQLARILQQQGVTLETCVGICLDRSIEFIVSILAILKAGGVYVPLDPEYPQERLDYTIEDTQMGILLTTTAQAKRFSHLDLPILYLDREGDRAARQNSQNLSIKVHPQNLAYINYTSGSTGQPKGIGISHSSVTHLVLGKNIVQFTPGDRMAHLSNISFDAVTFEIWGPLLNGASLVVLPTSVVLSPPDLGRAITEKNITLMWLTVALFNQMVQEAPDALSALRCLIFGGEMANAEIVRQLLETSSPQQLLNGYGPTETTTFATFYPVESSEISKILIGRPLAGVYSYILDPHLEPVPVGVPGELYIGGSGLARGYINRPDLTACQFIPDPFSQNPGGRLYATGDLARYCPDGQIEILGRIDNQVKIRGFRVEPEEVEATLLAHPDVKEATILVKSKPSGDKVLVAYFVGGNIEDLRHYLKSKLPNFLIPSAFVPLSKLPLTPNGKLDRRSLPEPQTLHFTLNNQEQPRTPTEEIVAGVWSQVLEIEEVGIHDNFFDLGGHSLLATQVISRLLKVIDVKVPVQTLFAGPTVAELAAYINQEYQSLDSPSSLTAYPTIQPMARSGALVETESLPLSFAQKRLWFVCQLVPDSPGYNIPTAYRLVGELNANLLEQTLGQIIARHETLRTNFIAQQGEPLQVIRSAQSQPLQLLVVEPEGASRAERERAIDRWIDEAALRPFDLSQDSLMRAALFPLAPEEHILFLNIHHIIADGWSLGVLHRELSILYRARWEGKPNPLPELPIQYADFAHWQTQWLQGERLESQLTYWRRQLADLPLLGLHSDRPRPPVQTFLGRAANFKLSAHLSQQLKRISRQEGATLFMTLLSAFKVLLYRYTGQEDIAVGFPIANRNRTEIETLIGFFVNTLVLRTDLSGNPRFQDLLERVRETTLQAYAHQDLPFERLVEELEPDRDPSRNPLVQVVFALQNSPARMPELPNLTVTSVDLEIQTTRFDIECHLWETPEGLIGKFIYNTELFEPETGSRMLEHFMRLLEQIGAAPDRPIAEFSLLTRAEQQQIVEEWNQTAHDYPRDLCIHQAFELQVEKTPEAIALISDKTSLTYAQLNQYANQLAHQLQEKGVKAEDIVGIVMERSPLTILVILATLKVGGVYLPLDPKTPQHRLISILEETQPSILLTQTSLLANLPEWEGLIITCELHQLNSPSENLPCTIQPDHLAYIMYTSGSTGKPKGIGISHRAVMRLVNQPNYVSITPQDSILELAPVTFDAATFEIWGSLLNGAKLAILPPHVPSLEEIAAAIIEYQITTLFMTTALFHLMVKEKIDSLAALKQLLVGGEVMSVDLLQHFIQHAPNCQTINAYGPTENTTFTTFYPVNSTQKFALSVPIGRPISSTTTYILDSQMNPSPVGIPGELYTGGDGLAQFYFQRPELTAQKFVPHPFSHKPGDRLYKTGDLARYLPDGNIDFLGRIDTQVKIRGFRIEPGEIESLLNQHPTIKTSVVVPREEAGNKQLVAYLVNQLETEAAIIGGQEHISQWQTLFEQTYHQSSDVARSDFNLAGWNDSYTEEAILPEAMAEWVTQTVNSIMANPPQRVLEIGCGTGLLLLRIAPHCSDYLGTDFSSEALQYVQQQLREQQLSQVELRRQLADNFDGIIPNRYDTIILNSIVQYFPGITYFLQVLQGAIKATAPGGRIFIGDLRCFPLLDAFHTSVHLYGASDRLSVPQLRENIQKSQRFEGELAIDPAFFKQLPDEIPEISAVEILHKRGTYDNELTKYRYDVILHLGKKSKALPSESTYNWQNLSLQMERNPEESPLEKLRHFLENQKAPLSLCHIPNRRIWADIKSCQLLENLDEMATVASLRYRLDEMLRLEPSFDPETFFSLGEDLGYTTKVVWSQEGKQGYFDVLFIPPECSTIFTSPFLSGISKHREWSRYANNPIVEKLTHQVVPILRSYLAEKLPDYMIPSHFVVLDAIPLNQNGKINKHALPPPKAIRPDLEATYQAPSSSLEQIIAQIWQKYLRVDRVGIEDNFFDLGGHSLLLVQIFSEIQSQVDKPFSIVDIFQYPTVSSLAQYLSQDEDRTQSQLQSQTEERAKKRKIALRRNNPRSQK